MEHLICMTPQDLSYFLQVTEMEVLSVDADSVVAKGSQIFQYVWDMSKGMFCLMQGEPA